MYNHSALDVPWYAVLGNHDYGDGATDAEDEACLAEDGGCTRSPLHQVRCTLQSTTLLYVCAVCTHGDYCQMIAHRPSQLDASLFARDSRWNCARFYTMALAGGAAELFFMDTSPFVLKYRQRPWARFHGVLRRP